MMKLKESTRLSLMRTSFINMCLYSTNDSVFLVLNMVLHLQVDGAWVSTVWSCF